MSVEMVSAQADAYRYDVFVSYSHDDTQWVTEILLEALKAADIAVISDGDLETGTNWVQWIPETIDSSRHLLCVMTPEWVTSKWGGLELTFGVEGDPSPRLGKLLPVLLKPCEIPPLLRVVQHTDLTNAAVFDKQLNKLIALIKRRSDSISVPAPASSLTARAELEVVGAEPVINNLRELTEMVRNSQIREALKRFDDHFKGTDDHVERLADFKAVHDQLNRLQVDFLTIVISEVSYGNRSAYRSYLAGLRGVIESIRDVERKNNTGALRWVEKLEEAQALLESAMRTDADDFRALGEALDLIEYVLTRHTASVNSSVSAAAAALHLEHLIEMIAFICEVAKSIDSAQSERLQHGFGELRRLVCNLAELVNAHDLWQNTDDDLRFIDRALSAAVIAGLMEDAKLAESNTADPGLIDSARKSRWPDHATLDRFWAEAVEGVAALAGDAAWSQFLHEPKRRIDEAVSNRDMKKMREHYPEYRRLTVDRFFKVDWSLKRQCDELRHVAGELVSTWSVLYE